MKKAAEYQRHAQECRTLARKAMTEDERSQLLTMSETWLQLAEQRMVAERLAGKSNEGTGKE